MIEAVALAISAASTGGALALAAAERRARGARLLGVQRACHELRGPITAVRLGVQLGVRTGELSLDRMRALDLELGRAGLALDDLTHPGPRLAPRRRSAVDMRELVAASVLAWSASAELHGRELRMGWRADAVAVRADGIRLAQVLGNLLANAIEHGAGPIIVTAEARSGRVRVEVADEGPGLPARVAASLRAERPASPRTRARGNESLASLRWACRIPVRRDRRDHRPDPRHGHGLAISAQIAALHGGSLTAVPGGPGARLVLELPLAG